VVAGSFIHQYVPLLPEHLIKKQGSSSKRCKYEDERDTSTLSRPKIYT
jgi:hypothetical protein